MSEPRMFKVVKAEVSKTEVGKYKNNEITATLENGDGKQAEVTFLQKPETPVPAAGDELNGTVEQSQYGLKFRKASPYGSNGTGGYSKDREESIDRAVAIKSATQLVSARIMAGELKGQEAAHAALEAMTVDIISLVKGDKAAEGKAEEPKKPVDSDSDIPF